MDTDELRRHVCRSHTSLRMGMGLLAMALPFILCVIGPKLRIPIPIQGSLSAYYHTGMRDIFVGILCAIGMFLYLYKGFTQQENYVLNFAGVCAILVALLPADKLLDGYDLRLMSWVDSSAVPTSGKNLVVVGTDNNGLLHIRSFDFVGNRITDKVETQLPNQTAAIATLKQKLPNLMPPHEPTLAEKEMVIGVATSIVGQTLVPIPFLKQTWTSQLHTVFASLFILGTAGVCIFLSSTTLQYVHTRRRQRFYYAAYKLIGLCMVIIPFAAHFTINRLQSDVTQKLNVLAIEVAALLIFSGFWLLKSKEVHDSEADWEAKAPAEASVTGV